MYTPHPIDTSAVELPAELLALSERLAKNVHEVWAETRLASGWRYGARRDDERRETPCLVPYEALPEDEREIDRRMCVELLKLVRTLGYAITKEADHAPEEAP